jgi:PRTRC genetic system protein E
MDFFKQLAGIAGNIDLNMRIMSKGDSITVSILPATTDKLQPLTVTGTAEELDSGLMDLVRKPLELVAGLTSNAAEFEAAVTKSQDKGTVKGKKEDKKPATPVKQLTTEAPKQPELTPVEDPTPADEATTNEPVAAAEPTPPAAPAIPKPGPPRPVPTPA